MNKLKRGNTTIWVIGVLVIALVLFLVLRGNDENDPINEETNNGVSSGALVPELTVDLKEVAGSGMSGNAKIETVEGGMLVTLSLPQDQGERPAHLHAGRCENPGGIEYPLNNIVNGNSETMLPGITMADLITTQELYVNAHESESNLGRSIACGNLPFTSEMVVNDNISVNASGSMETDLETPVDSILERGEFHVISYTKEGFRPETLTIEQGETVRFVNNSNGGMWVASAIHPTHAAYPIKGENDCLGSSFDQCDDSLPGSFWEFTFDAEGEHGYHNHVRASDWGKVIVR